MKLPPDPSEPGYDDAHAVLDEAMKVLQLLNAKGAHSLETIDRHVALTFRHEAVKKRRALEDLPDRQSAEPSSAGIGCKDPQAGP